jgi:hypothetical protein
MSVVSAKSPIDLRGDVPGDACALVIQAAIGRSQRERLGFEQIPGQQVAYSTYNMNISEDLVMSVVWQGSIGRERTIGIYGETLFCIL